MKWVSGELQMLKEVKMRESLHHNNIVSYKHSWLEMAQSGSFGPRVPWLFVLMEFCDGGDLECLIEDLKSTNCEVLTDDEVW